MQSRKDFDWLIEELDILKFPNCPLGNSYIYNLFFTNEVPAKDAAHKLVKDCPICYLISLVILAKEENWTLDELRREFLQYINNKEN